MSRPVHLAAIYSFGEFTRKLIVPLGGSWQSQPQPGTSVALGVIDHPVALASEMQPSSAGQRRSINFFSRVRSTFARLVRPENDATPHECDDIDVDLRVLNFAIPLTVSQCSCSTSSTITAFAVNFHPAPGLSADRPLAVCVEVLEPHRRCGNQFRQSRQLGDAGIKENALQLAQFVGEGGQHRVLGLVRRRRRFGRSGL